MKLPPEKKELDQSKRPEEYARIRSIQLELAQRGRIMESARYAIEAAKLRDSRRMLAR
ncbi:hypothetical protein KS4_31380 [Poriferisphaera corsica]|uniref:Uncharacterized protein n=1 Tax=Poriferisphaera corsica TaxID=2528020 RepID=A0A517YXV4_9BACT|nr:hypothetical protein [Poriferisphaera corsica]QDU35060.1 hypothetical protein KS4_31380 [Poriferisphaera corsica]